MIPLLVLAIVLQLADLATFSATREANPIALNPLGIPAKMLLVVFLVAGAKAVGPRWAPVLLVAAIAGAVGLWSNL